MEWRMVMATRPSANCCSAGASRYSLPGGGATWCLAHRSRSNCSTPSLVGLLTVILARSGVARLVQLTRGRQQVVPRPVVLRRVEADGFEGALVVVDDERLGHVGEAHR